VHIPKPSWQEVQSPPRRSFRLSDRQLASSNARRSLELAVSKEKNSSWQSQERRRRGVRYDRRVSRESSWNECHRAGKSSGNRRSRLLILAGACFSKGWGESRGFEGRRYMKRPAGIETVAIRNATVLSVSTNNVDGVSLERIFRESGWSVYTNSEWTLIASPTLDSAFSALREAPVPNRNLRS
jgi:hypothetical protein